MSTNTKVKRTYNPKDTVIQTPNGEKVLNFLQVRRLKKIANQNFKNTAMPLEVFQERAKVNDPKVYGRS